MAHLLTTSSGGVIFGCGFVKGSSRFLRGRVYHHIDLRTRIVAGEMGSLCVGYVEVVRSDDSSFRVPFLTTSSDCGAMASRPRAHPHRLLRLCRRSRTMAFLRAEGATARGSGGTSSSEEGRFLFKVDDLPPGEDGVGGSGRTISLGGGVTPGPFGSGRWSENIFWPPLYLKKYHPNFFGKLY